MLNNYFYHYFDDHLFLVVERTEVSHVYKLLDTELKDSKSIKTFKDTFTDKTELEKIASENEQFRLYAAMHYTDVHVVHVCNIKTENIEYDKDVNQIDIIKARRA